MSILLPLVSLAGLLALIWYLGTGQFGRAQTQRWIDRFRSAPRVYTFLDRHHGKFRAAAHYLEFGGLFLVLYWVWDTSFGTGSFAFRTSPAIVIAVVCAVAAYLDELHQLRSGGRQFRREDFLHSLCGITLAAAIVMYQTIVRGIE